MYWYPIGKVCNTLRIGYECIALQERSQPLSLALFVFLFFSSFKQKGATRHYLQHSLLASVKSDALLREKRLTEMDLVIVLRMERWYVVFRNRATAAM